VEVRLNGARRGFLAAACLALVLSACTGRITGGEAEENDGDRDAGERDGAVQAPHDDAGADSSAPSEPDGSEPEPIACDDLGTLGAPVPMRRLNASQVERTVANVLGVSETLDVTDEKLFTFRSNISTSIDMAAARSYLDFAEAVSEDAELEACGGAVVEVSECEASLFDDVGPRLFRRPLTDEERTRYRDLRELGGQDGARWVLQAMLQSPTFLYVDEVAGEDGYLDDYGIAARLAFVLWGSNPDAALLTRAAQGELGSPQQIREQAARMLDDPKSVDGLADFVDQWLELHRLSDADSRPDIAALGLPTVRALREEPVRLFASLLQSGGSLSDLLTTARTVRSDELQSTYGDDIAMSSEDAFMLDATRRAGILALPGVMAALSHAEMTSPTLRGYAVLASFLCAPPGPPPAGVNVTLPDVGPNATARERLEAHFTDDVCGACHRTMDGIGFAFESIDWLGRSRTMEHGIEIDDTSTFELAGDEMTVDGVTEIASALAQSEAVASCVARQWARYATGVRETKDADCLVRALGEAITEPEGLREMMLTYVSSDWFRRAAVFEEDEP
jgi:hypothetical protein